MSTREFNTFGPVDPALHYHVNRVAVKASIHQKIEKGRYFTLNAARQAGKTTLFREVIAELEASGEYVGILLSFEALRSYSSVRFYERLAEVIQEHHLPALQHLAKEKMLLSELHLRDHGKFGDWLREVGQQLQRKVLLIIDEFDAIGGELAEPMLAVFRDMYLHRHLPTYHALHSIILVGVRNIPALLGGSQSPFNIADQYEVPYFTPAETEDLLRQHTAETGQPFTPETLAATYRETEGQPFLVNRLGQLLTQTVLPERTMTIESRHFEMALQRLLKENNTHFASIISKATPHQKALLSILFYDQRRSDFVDPITQELLMYGILRVIEDEYGNLLARIANPIYRKRLIMVFKPSHGALAGELNGSFHHRYVLDGVLDFEGVLTGFQRMMTEHGIRLLRSKQTNQPLEIGGQYLLLSYLTASVETIGGYISLESVNSAGEMDVVVFYRGERFIIETKIWYSLKRFKQGQQQLAAYLKASGQTKGYMVVFCQEEAAVPLEATVDGTDQLAYPVVIGR